jgi:hypothetical protein
MKRFLRILIYLVVLNIIIYLSYTAIVWFNKIQTKNLFNKYSHNSSIYCYWTDSMMIEQTYFIKDLKDSSAIVDYYDYKSNMRYNKSYADKFYMNSLSPLTKVFKIEEKGNLVKIIHFKTNCWGHCIGYVDKRVVNLVPPDSTYLNFNVFVKTDDNDNQSKWFYDRNYGIQCLFQ